MTRLQSEMDSLAVPECYQLLAGRSLGRLGVVLEGAPLIIPVNYAVDRGTIVIRTAPGSVVARSDGTDVAFQVDDLHLDSHSGWSVLARGPAAALTPAETRELAARVPPNTVQPWAPGDRPLWLRIIPQDIAGRRIVSGDDLGWRLGTAAYM